MNYSYAERVWYQTALLMLALIPLTFVASHFDTRILNGIPIWVKPQKFHVSIAVHLLTFAILLRFLPEKTRTALWLSLVAGISALATIIEIFLIDYQAARGVHSHFNFSSDFDSLIYAGMGVAALLLSAPALILGLYFLLAPSSEKLTPGLKLGAGLGLTFGFFLTLGFAGYLSSLPSGHWVNAPTTDAGGLPIVGWSREGGDLRVPHFFATHMMQVLPLAGLLLDKLMKDKEAIIKIGVAIASVLGVGITVGTFMQAMAGKPFIG